MKTKTIRIKYQKKIELAVNSLLLTPEEQNALVAKIMKEIEPLFKISTLKKKIRKLKKKMI